METHRPFPDVIGHNSYAGSFARLYEYAFNEWARLFSPVLQAYLAEAAPARGALLDICCGTCEIARALLTDGWQIIGLDRSPDMLVIAAEKHVLAINEGRLVLAVAQAENFQRSEDFETCICMDGALNHFADLPALQSCFQSVSRVLRPEGLFVFDLLEAAHFARWREMYVSEDAQHLLVRRGAWDPERNLAQLDILGGIGGAAFWRVRETLLSRTFNRAEVEAALKAAGLIPEPCTLKDIRPSERSFYQARRHSGR